jgi:hypothetical protein
LKHLANVLQNYFEIFRNPGLLAYKHMSENEVEVSPNLSFLPWAPGGSPGSSWLSLAPLGNHGSSWASLGSRAGASVPKAARISVAPGCSWLPWPLLAPPGFSCCCQKSNLLRKRQQIWRHPAPPGYLLDAPGPPRPLGFLAPPTWCVLGAPRCGFWPWVILASPGSQEKPGR